MRAYVCCAVLTMLALAAWGAVAAFFTFAVIAGLVGFYTLGKEA